MLTTAEEAATPRARPAVRTGGAGWPGRGGSAGRCGCTILAGTAWAVVRTFGLESGFPAVALIAFTPYVAVLSVFPLLIAVAARRWRAVVVAAAVVLAFGVAVLPRTLPDDQGSAGGGPRLRVLTANVHYGEVPAADVIALVRRLDVDVVASRSSRRSCPVTSTGPVWARCCRTGSCRTASARTPASTPGTRSGRCWPAAIRCSPSRARWSRCRAPGRWRCAPSTPPLRRTPTTPGNAGAAWPRCRRRAVPVRILAGDFNATLDHVEFRRVLDGGYRDAADAVGAGLHPTWSLRGPCRR